ncbi:MAG: hypothetical protein ACOC9Y_04915 [Chloroflexota bacterium]
MPSIHATPGGEAIRILRGNAGRTQLWVELEADLGTGYLQRIESGRVAQPTRATLERILSALDARYSERREIMQAFGYVVTTPKPNRDDREWAREISKSELQTLTFPVYVLDCAHRLTAWNRYIPWMFGVSPADPIFTSLQQNSVLAAWFDVNSPIGASVSDRDTLLPALIRAFRYEMHRFSREPWYEQLLEDLYSQRRFRHYWDIVEKEAPVASAARALIPVEIEHPDHGQLAFRLSSEPFIRDARFRFVHFFPADPVTMQQCANVQGEPGIENTEVHGASTIDRRKHALRDFRIDPVSRLYITTALRIGEEIEGYIDAFHGPDDLRDEAAKIDDIQNALGALEAEVEALPSSARKTFLRGQARSMRAVYGVHRDESMSYADEVEATFNIRPVWTDEQHFERAHLQLEQVLPGDGSLRDRRERYMRGFELEGGEVEPFVEQLRRDLRDRTASIIDLPPGEGAEVELVNDKPWSGYNWYLGGYQSRIEVNTDLPVRANALPDLVAHEIYPGHHTEHSLKEYHWLDRQGFGEAAIALLTSPQAVVSEGIATTALDTAVPDSEQAGWLRDMCFSPAGFDADPEIDLAIQRAGEELRGVAGNAALMLHDQRRPEQDVVDYLMRWSLRDEKEARQLIRFITTPILRCYIFTYAMGRDLVEQYLKRSNDRQEAVRSLLTEHWTPGMLRET